MTYYYISYYTILTYYYCLNEPIITVIMDPLIIIGPLLPIFTRSLMGKNGFIIVHYVPGQLADDKTHFLQRKGAVPAKASLVKQLIVSYHDIF